MHLPYVMLFFGFALFGCNDTNDDLVEESSQWKITSDSVGATPVVIIEGFKAPYGLAVSRDQRLYVPDLTEGRVIRFSGGLSFDSWLGFSVETGASGWFDESYTVETTHKESPRGPHSVTFDSSGRIIVAAYYNLTVNVYDNSGNFVEFVNNSPNDLTLKFEGPANVYIDQLENLWVSDYASHRIYKFDPNLNLIGWLGATEAGISNGFVSTGVPVASSELGGFNKPHMVRVDDNGFIYVVEVGNNRIQKFDPLGNVVGWIGARKSGGITSQFEPSGESVASSEVGGFNQPISVNIYNSEFLLIADYSNNRIQKFTLNGEFIGWIGGSKSNIYASWTDENVPSISDSRPGYFDRPFDTVYVDGKLYIADGGNKRIKIYHLRGK